jgi:hypothetical protein
VDIFLGKIVQWDNPKILADNPLIAADRFPNNTITLVARGSASIDNLIINAVFSKVSEEWADLANQTIGGLLPTPIYALPHVHTAKGNDELLGITDGSSLGYAPWSVVREFNQPTANIINQAGAEVSPTAVTQSEDILEDVFDDILTNVADLDEPEAYPFMGMSYALFRGNMVNVTDELCNRTTVLYRFLRWTQMTAYAENSAEHWGFGSLPPRVRNFTRAMLESATCNGEFILQYNLTRLAPASEPGRIFLIAFAVTGIVTCVGLAIAFYVLAGINSERIPREELIFTFLIIVGAVMTFTSVFMWQRDPVLATTCHARIWLMVFGLYTLLSAIFTRTWHLHRIYNQMYRLQKLSVRVRGVTEVLAGAAVVLVLTTVFLLVWHLVDPYTTTISIFNEVEMTGEYTCTSEHFVAWIVVFAGIIVALLIWGIFVVYRAWAIKDKANEVRWLLLGGYNFFLTLVAVVPILLAVPQTDETTFYVIGTALNFITASIVIAIFVPKLSNQAKIRSSRSGSSQRSQRATSTKQDGSNINLNSKRDQEPLPVSIPVDSHPQDDESTTTSEKDDK